MSLRDDLQYPSQDVGTQEGHIIYNTTYQVLHAAHNDWLRWMQDVQIPEVVGTGCFVKHQLVRLLEADETEGPLYAIQYYAACRQDYDRYMALYDARLKRQGQQLWGNAVFGFSSLMQVMV